MAGLRGLMNLYEQKPPPQQSTQPTTNSTPSEKEKPKTTDSNNKDSVFRIAKTNPTKSSGQQTCELRVQNDLSNIDAAATPGVHLEVNPNDLLHFNVTVEPQDGYWKGAKFTFVINIPHDYPFTAPEVVCNTLIYHPNIDFKGRVCLNILRFEWSAALGLGHVLFGMMTLFLEPNPDDPLNIEAADLMVKNLPKFKQNVYDSLRGKTVSGHQFPKLL